MRTRNAQKPSPASTPAPQQAHQARQGEHSVFEALLQRPRQSAVPTAPATRAEGIAIGVLSRVDEHGGIWVDIASLGLHQLAAVSMVQLGAHHIGQALALGFEGANAQRPVVLGLMMQANQANQANQTATPNTAPNATPNAVRVMQQGRKVVIEAQTELELRCGEAVILLSEDGHVQIRGAYVTSHASASQRIRGGSVQIN